jgi:hypothetical protein
MCSAILPGYFFGIEMQFITINVWLHIQGWDTDGMQL